MEQIPSSNEVTDSPVARIPRTEDGSVDWSQVSSQLLNILFYLIYPRSSCLVCPYLEINSWLILDNHPDIAFICWGEILPFIQS